jgi:DNA replication and repair protein RecF
MSYLREITLFQFKNYPEKSYTFSQKIVGLTGKNGVGKTNLLDAIHYLCLTKSYFGRNDQQTVLVGKEGFSVKGVFEKEEQTNVISCIYRENGKKEFLIDGNPITRNADHIGQYPLILIAPDDIFLITGESRERRAFIDQLIAQLDPVYLTQLLTYNRLLQQRNALLKNWSEKGTSERGVLAILDEQLLTPAHYLFEKRTEILQQLIPEAKNIYQSLATAGNATRVEEPQLFYTSELQKKSFADLLQQNRERDLFLQRTTKGIHRDDLTCTLQELPFKQIASQGQRKSLLFALKLAALQLLEWKQSTPPLLLLDDIFEKLDENRVAQLIKLVSQHTASQVFLTHTSSEKLHAHLSKATPSFEIIEIKAS